VLIRRRHVAPRGGVTLLAQLTAGSFGTGWAHHAASIAVTLVPALAAITSFSGTRGCGVAPPAVLLRWH
jgi:hypothetical protein